MAEGDLIVGPTYPQYEFNSWMFGSSTERIVTSVKGLFDTPDVRTTDTERQDAWGDFPGSRFYKARFPEFGISIASTPASIEQYLINLPGIFVAESLARMLVFQRTGDVKKFVWAKVEKLNFESNYDLAHGLMVVDLMFKCDDPRKYSLVEFANAITIPNTLASTAGAVTNSGNIDARPILEINGPCTNPRIQNAQDSNKSIKIDLVLAAGQMLLVDVRTRTVTLGGVDYSQYVRADNQWWYLKPGVNNITFSRSDNGAAATLNVRHRDTWN